MTLAGAARPKAPARGDAAASADDISPAWRGVTRLLVIRLDNLGDVLMSTPAIAALKAALPTAHITLLASPSGAAALPFIDALDAVIVADAPWMKGGAQAGIETPGKADISTGAAADDPPLGTAEADLVATLAAGRFDAAVIFTTCTQSALPAALVCRMAGIALRLAHCGENPYRLLSDWVIDRDVIADGMRHEVARQLALVASIGCRILDDRLRWHVRSADRRSLDRRLQALGVRSEQPLFVVHPGASAESRRWPARRFGLAADRIARGSGRLAVFTGSAAEAGLVDEARAAMAGASQSLPGLQLGELAALLERAELLLGNNSGPAHIAAALGTAVVDLYALTNPQHTPWRVPARVLSHPVPCRNCLKSVCPVGHHDCLRGVEPLAAASAGLELLGCSALAASSFVPVPVPVPVSASASASVAAPAPAPQSASASLAETTP